MTAFTLIVCLALANGTACVHIAQVGEAQCKAQEQMINIQKYQMVGSWRYRWYAKCVMGAFRELPPKNKSGR